MKYTALVALSLATASASVDSIIRYLPADGADIVTNCDGDDDSLVSRAEFDTCYRSSVPRKQQRRWDRTLDREWATWDTDSTGLDNDEVKAMYYAAECSDSDGEDNGHCSLARVHEWFGDDLSVCAADVAADGCATIPAGAEFTGDLHLAAAFAYVDADSDDAWSEDEQGWLSTHILLSRYSQWAPSDLVSTCDTDESDLADGSGFSGDLSKTELYDCWVANVPECLVATFDTDFETLWTAFDADTNDTLDTGDEFDFAAGALAEVSDWHSSSSSDGEADHSACPPEERRLSVANLVSSFFN